MDGRCGKLQKGGLQRVRERGEGQRGEITKAKNTGSRGGWKKTPSAILWSKRSPLVRKIVADRPFSLSLSFFFFFLLRYFTRDELTSWTKTKLFSIEYIFDILSFELREATLRRRWKCKLTNRHSLEIGNFTKSGVFFLERNTLRIKSIYLWTLKYLIRAVQFFFFLINLIQKIKISSQTLCLRFLKYTHTQISKQIMEKQDP